MISDMIPWLDSPVFKDLSSVGPDSEFDSGSRREYLRTDTQIIRLQATLVKK